MRRFLTLFKKINTAQECVNHNTKQLPHILANESCATCGIDICYLCGSKHLEHGCNVKSIALFPHLILSGRIQPHKNCLIRKSILNRSIQCSAKSQKARKIQFEGLDFCRPLKTILHLRQENHRIRPEYILRDLPLGINTFYLY